MAQVVVTLKIMPASPEADLSLIQTKAEEEIKAFSGETEIKAEIEPIAFGLKALKLLFVMDEDKGSTEELENNIKNIESVNSAETVDVRRAVG
jgi:elongation factor 1-beta|tara:strand:+ start:797 stop:1075 length:279 start_codon:yes stop_codon:yes gene_type:complete